MAQPAVGPWCSKLIPCVGRAPCWSRAVSEALHVLPESRHRHPTARMQPLFPGEGIWLLLLWQGSSRSSPASGGEVPAAPPAPCAALGNRFLFFPQLHLHQRLHWFARGNPIPVTAGPPGAARGVQSPSLGTENITGPFGWELAHETFTQLGIQVYLGCACSGQSPSDPRGGEGRGGQKLSAASAASSCLPEPPSLPPSPLPANSASHRVLDTATLREAHQSQQRGWDDPPRHGHAGVFVLTSPAYYNFNGI